VQTLVVTEIGLTVFAPLLVWEQTLLVDEIGKYAGGCRFLCSASNVDNDSAFMSARGRISFNPAIEDLSHACCTMLA